MNKVRTFTVNCGDDADCQCRQRDNLETITKNRDMSAHSVRMTVNLSGVEVRTETMNGQEYRVVPVVMARADVVMNGALVPESELVPEAWNGVPVTVGHPELPGGGFLSANAPDVLETWSVGQIFNARVDGGALKAEAWINVAQASKIYPTLIDELSGGTMDVSTGYFSKDETRGGTINGKTYDRVSRDLLPDHLALLPGDVGACSWEDGCGVRNKENGMSDKLAAAMSMIANALGLNKETERMTPEQIVEKLRTNKRGPDDDHRQMVADLISNDDSPYVPDDMYALSDMSHDSLVATRDKWLNADDGDEEPEVNKGKSADGDEPEVNANSEGGQDLADEKNEAAKTNSAADGALPQTVGELNEMIANAVAKGIEGAMKTVTANALTDEDRAALEQARKIQAEHRNGLIAKITANSDVTKEQAEAMDAATLEVVANGIRPAGGDYGGRPLPTVNSISDDEAEEYGSVPTLDEALSANTAQRNAKVN